MGLAKQILANVNLQLDSKRCINMCVLKGGGYSLCTKIKTNFKQEKLFNYLITC